MWCRVIFATLALLAGRCAPTEQKVGQVAGQMAGTNAFAHPYFEDRWDAGEITLPGFWGPLSTASGGIMERYGEDASTGMPTRRLVQYFDKGRMELERGNVTFGALVAEMILGQVGIGNNTIEACPTPAIAIAGDGGAGNPTYASIVRQHADRFARAAAQVGSYPPEILDAAGQLRMGNTSASLFEYTIYESRAGHNIPRVFADYRDQVNRFRSRTFPGVPDLPQQLFLSGEDMLGPPMSEPFAETISVKGVWTPIYVQVFTRRTLIYNAVNPNPLQVEMGDVGRHYYQWRYGEHGCSRAN